MSNAEISSQSSPEYSVLYTLAVGQFTNTAAIPNYLGECSKIVGVVRTTAIAPASAPVSVTKGAVVALVGPPAVAGFPTIRLSSADAGDVNSYRIFWVNQVAASPYDAVQGC
jgi:hypothetical protein